MKLNANNRTKLASDLPPFVDAEYANLMREKRQLDETMEGIRAIMDLMKKTGAKTVGDLEKMGLIQFLGPVEGD